MPSRGLLAVEDAGALRLAITKSQWQSGNSFAVVDDTFDVERYRVEFGKGLTIVTVNREDNALPDIRLGYLLSLLLPLLFGEGEHVDLVRIVDLLGATKWNDVERSFGATTSPSWMKVII